MKKLLIILAAIALFASCDEKPKEPTYCWTIKTRTDTIRPENNQTISRVDVVEGYFCGLTEEQAEKKRKSYESETINDDGNIVRVTAKKWRPE